MFTHRLYTFSPFLCKILLVLTSLSLQTFEESTAISSPNYFLKKEGFYKPFVVLILRYKKLEKN